MPRIAGRAVELVGAVCAVRPAVAAPAEADALAALAAELARGVAGVAVALVGRVHAVERAVADLVLVHADAVAAPELARPTRACLDDGRGDNKCGSHIDLPLQIQPFCLDTSQNQLLQTRISTNRIP